ncbi:MAG: hypothetical protein EOM19_03020 [Candidatus Moranbacteria bacterium]|nr:hypothetical protein [Candidatus Moranbacteria bacterium]
MILFITLSSHKAKLEIRHNEANIDSTEFSIDGDLASHLLSEIDNLLSRKGLEKKELFDIQLEMKEVGSTTERIAQSVVNTFYFTKKYF